jgi:hypothetical protein
VGLEGRNRQVNAKFRKGRAASDRFVFSGRRGEHLQVNTEVR